MKEEKKNRSKRLHVRFTEAEYNNLQDKFSKTTCRQVSEYARKVLLQKPVTVYHRDQSLDELMQQLIGLKNDLSAIANNYNQVVRKLHTLQHVPELKSWLILHEKALAILTEKIAAIKSITAQLSDRWLQS